ncbi:deoxyribose-phosphate aldolase, partial [Legionella drancourtii]|uniref:deoxyribose-phosphate aldolase n=1 Tax=Legionella drancourtii TaxID=168933 RepID=UPI00058CAE34
LDEEASLTSLSQLNKDARCNNVAAICVYSKHLSEFHQLKAIQLATVINFPHGNEDLTTSCDVIEKALTLGATEIDYVLPYQLYLDGKKDAALQQCQTIIKLCKHHNLTSKIILETGAFPALELIYDASKDLIESGCDFLKTSTGKIAQGASLPAVFTMLSAIKDTNVPCGIKVSGGVKTPTQAFNYATLAEFMMDKTIDKSWFRIGASSLLGELI